LKYKAKKHTLGLYSGLYEVRIDVGSDIYRVFSFFDKGKLVILINGFQKKTQKTPKKEIKIGEKLKSQYFEELKQTKK
jgi:phage-related protein